MTTQTFKGKTALILGGTSGIGKATAELLLLRGANVHIASKSERSVGPALQALRGLGTVTGHQVDLTNQPDVMSLIEKFSKKADPVDSLVNAAGIFGPRPFLDYKPEEYDAYLDLNRGFFFITQAV